MDDSMSVALKGILDDYAQRRSREIAVRKAEQERLEEFRRNVMATLDTIITPCFQGFADELKRHNHDCAIEGTRADPADKRGDALVKITIFPDGVKLPHGNASLSYIALYHCQRLSAQRSVTSRDGSLIPGAIGEYELAQITPALVDQNLLDLAQAVFAAR